jgi:hypothetical protein
MITPLAPGRTELKAQAAAEAVKNDLNKGNGFDLGDDPVSWMKSEGVSGTCDWAVQPVRRQYEQPGNIVAVVGQSNQAYSSSLTAVGSINVGNDFEVNCSPRRYAMCGSFNAFTGIDSPIRPLAR